MIVQHVEAHQMQYSAAEQPQRVTGKHGQHACELRKILKVFTFTRSFAISEMDTMMKQHLVYN